MTFSYSINVLINYIASRVKPSIFYIICVPIGNILEVLVDYNINM